MKRPPRDLFVAAIGAQTFAIFVATGWLAYTNAALLVVCLFIVVNWPEP